MSDERSDLTVRTGHRDAPVDPPSEVGETVLKVVMGNLHNVWGDRMTLVVNPIQHRPREEGRGRR